MFSDNNNYMSIIDEIEVKMDLLNERIPSVFSPLICEAGQEGMDEKMERCLGFMERKDLCYADFSYVMSYYLAVKPERNMDPLLERLDNIMDILHDLPGSALLAASYYGMEELEMRLPRLLSILENPFGKIPVLSGGMKTDAASMTAGTILAADGGPAEGAKAIQLYFKFRERKGLNPTDPGILRMTGLLGILADRPSDLTEQIFAISDQMGLENRWEHLSETEKVLIACCKWMGDAVGSPEISDAMNLTAMNFLYGMPQEAAAVAAACLFPFALKMK